ncbi:M48 family metallopeptidase, partial [Acinetobacter baumannii]
EWVHVQLHQQKGMISLSPPTICNSAGIVNKLNLTDAEIAAVMGHEMTHALEEHAKSKIGAQALTDLALNIGLSQINGGNVSQLGAAAAQLGTQVGVGLPYSRSLESRADQGGLMLMARAGYNPNAAITLWEKMNKLEGSGSSFLSTHPSNAQRINDMRKNLPAALAIYNGRK